MYSRKSIRLKRYDYRKSGFYYITISTLDKSHIFGKVRNNHVILNKFGEIALNEWINTGILRSNVILDQYVIMPNHIHGIIFLNNEGTMHRAPTEEKFGKPVCGSIPTIIRAYKSAVSRNINKIRDISRGKIWQKNYYEEIIRNSNDLDRVREYIRMNPYNFKYVKE